MCETWNDVVLCVAIKMVCFSL